MIKESKTGTKEWSSHSFNFQKGCNHGCKYCYARKQLNRFEPEIDFDNPTFHLPKSSENLLKSKCKGVIMFPTMHDISEENKHRACEYLSRLLRLGNKVLWVTKASDPSFYVLGWIDAYMVDKNLDKKNLEIRVTIGSTSDETLEYWEPNTNSFNSRSHFLKCSHGCGFNTSISCEPMLDFSYEEMTGIFKYTTHGIWLGFMNGYTKIDNHFRYLCVPKKSDIDRIVNFMNEHKDKVHLKDSIKKVLENNNG